MITLFVPFMVIWQAALTWAVLRSYSIAREWLSEKLPGQGDSADAD